MCQFLNVVRYINEEKGSEMLNNELKVTQLKYGGLESRAQFSLVVKLIFFFLTIALSQDS